MNLWEGFESRNGEGAKTRAACSSQGYGAYGTCVPMSQASVQSMRRLSCEDAASLGSVSGYPEGRPNPVSEHADWGILLFLPCLVNARFWCNEQRSRPPKTHRFPSRSAR